MKNFILTIFLAVPLLGYNQTIKIYKEDINLKLIDTIEVGDKIQLRTKAQLTGSNYEQQIEIDNAKILGCDNLAESASDIYIAKDADCKILTFSTDADKKGDKKCFKIKNNKFAKIECPELDDKSSISSNKTQPKQNEDPRKIPIPNFKYFDVTEKVDEEKTDKGKKRKGKTKAYKVFVIDANPNPLKRLKNNICKVVDGKLLPAKNTALKVNANLPVFIKNYNFENLEEISVNIAGANYTFSNDISDLINEVKNGSVPGTTEDTTKNGAKDAVEGEFDNDRQKNIPHTYQDYLSKAKSLLSETLYLNLNDFLKLQAYKAQLIKAFEDTITKLDAKSISLYNDILAIYPEYIALTPIAIPIPDKDEATIALSFAEKTAAGDKNFEQTFGPYRTKGGISTSMGSSLFLTNLVDNSIVTDTIDNKLMATINEDSTKSVGVGVSYEVAFRTGTFFRPVAYLGFFVPFEKEISPFLALGVAGEVAFNKVKFNVGVGLATGFVNAINSKYAGKDLNQFPNYVEDIYVSKLNFGWQFKLGLSYNLNSEN